MIDHDVLEDLIRHAAEQIPVPADGPARVLAARDGMGAERVGRRAGARRRAALRLPRPRAALAALGAVAAVGLLVGVVGALGGSQPSSSSKSAPTALHAQAAGSGLAGLPSIAGSQKSAAGSAAGGSTPAGPLVAGPAASPSPVLPTKVIKTGSVTLQVGHGQVNNAISRLTTVASALGGFVASTNTNAAAGAPASGDLTMRVPAATFETLLNDVRALGTATAATTAGQDVTAQYVDLNARLQSLENTRAQFQQILTRAQNIGDILAVEQQINDLQTQIEQLQGQLRVMDDQTTYGALAVHVTETTPAPHAAAPPPSGLTRAWDHTRHTFARGLESVVAALGGIGVFLLCVLTLAGFGWLSWGVMRRRLV